jgi:hypothetical protein
MTRELYEDNNRNLYKYASDVPCGRRAVAWVAPVIKGTDRGLLPYKIGYNCDTAIEDLHKINVMTPQETLDKFGVSK